MIDRFAKWAFTLSLVPFILLIYPKLFIFTPLLDLVAIFLGVISLVRIRKSRQKGKGFAIAGIVISFLTLLTIIGVVIYVGTVAYSLL